MTNGRPSSISMPTTPKTRFINPRFALTPKPSHGLPPSSIRSNSPIFRPSRVHRNAHDVPTVFKHFPTPNLPRSLSATDLFTRSLPSTPISRSHGMYSPPSSSVRVQSPSSPIANHCDLPPASPVSYLDLNAIDIHYSPIHSPSYSSQVDTTVTTSTVTPSIPTVSDPISSSPSHSFISSPPSGPPLFSSHSSAPLSIHLPSSLSSFRQSSAVVPVMEEGDHSSLRRLYLTKFLNYCNPPPIPDSDPSQSRKSHIVHCDKTRAFILRGHAFMEENGVGDLSPSLFSKLLSINPQTVSRTISDSDIPSPLNRFPPYAPPPLKQTKKA